MRYALLPFATLAGFVVLVGVARADDFLQNEGDLWRASKLAGVNIYGPDKKKVGDISDVLMGKDGKATYVVVGVGGFLGIGQKDVAIPFDKVTFTQEPMPIPTPAMPPSTALPPATTNAPATGQANSAMPGVAPGAVPPAATPMGTPPAGSDTPAVANGMGVVAPAGGSMVNPALPRSTAYPDHGTVDYTVDQLKAAPTFTYAK